MEKPDIAVSVGDPSGIGPEVFLQALRDPEIGRTARFHVFGDQSVMEFYRRALEIDQQTAASVVWHAAGEPLDLHAWKPGKAGAETGKSAMENLQAAAEFVLTKRAQALVTGPMNKEAFRAAGYEVEGQTEFLGNLCGVSRFEMAILSGSLRVLLLSRHLPLRKALLQIRKERILDHIELGRNSMFQWGWREPKIAVAGLNPHAGERGLFGTEEAEEIIPAVEEARHRGWNVFGPISPDTVFRRAARGEFDLVLALYHDQAFIPVKTLNFEKAVTTILGLPLLRISVIHGTALELAGTGKADAGNMKEAIRTAVQWIHRQSRSEEGKGGRAEDGHL